MDMNNRFKILLVKPPWYRLLGKTFSWYPIGLCYLAAVLEKFGFQVSVYNADYNYQRLGKDIFRGVYRMSQEYHNYLRTLNNANGPLWQEIEEIIVQQSPDIVGISVTTPEYKSALNVAKIVKKIKSNTPVVVGGVHPTILPEEVLTNKEVDIAVRGEGEYTFIDLVTTMQSGGSLDRILGISYKKQNKIVHNSEKPLIKNLNDLPFPARHLLLKKETLPSYAFGRIFATRGCPYHCIFCASNKMWGRRVRCRSPENVVNEIKHVKKNFGTRFFFFEDDTFAINKQYAVKICNLLIQERLKITWGCETRPELITYDLVRKMKDAGCITMDVGVESGDDGILKKIKKGFTTEQVRSAKKILQRNGISFNAFFMFGFPWETKKEIRKTSSFLKELDSDAVIYSVVTPYPGTELYDIAVSEGIIPENIDWSFFFHQSPEMFLSKNLTRKEISQLIKYTERIAEEHNRKKRLKKVLTHPLSVLKMIYERGYYKCRFLPSLIRVLLRRFQLRRKVF